MSHTALLGKLLAGKLAALGITRSTGVAVALSGGADSLSLALAVSEWLKSDVRVPRDVRSGLDKIEPAQQPNPLEEHLSTPRQGRLMETASINRYLLLHRACKAKNISVLLTGHHAGDQAENLMIRTSRGSGIAGLAGICQASWSFLDTDHPLLLVRPFLDVHKGILEAACREQGLTWANDATNLDTSYLRNRMRALLSQTRTPAQSQQPPAVALLALSAVLQAVSFRHKQPALSSVQKLLSWISSGKLRHRLADNDCIISPVTFSKGCFMKVQPLPYVQPATQMPTSRRHQ
ncbi:hypothetical protein WJX79_006889 [Trebouxia sp. C0005]